jgi:hypothetical protein
MWKLTMTIEFECIEDMNEFLDELDDTGCYSSYVIDDKEEIEDE